MTIDDPSRPDHGDPLARALQHLHHAGEDLENAHQKERRAELELAEAERELDQALSARETEIIVNARKRAVKGNVVTFEEIVQLAFPGSHDPNVAFSMTYRHAASAPHSGELGPGGHVVVTNGTIFNVTKTIRS